MTDKDVIRIEGCIKGEKVLCLSCPYRDQYPDCRKYVIRDIFDVAKRQKAEIEKCENIIKLADKTIEKQSAEIERLQTENRILSQKRMNLFERLDFIEKTRAEAVKEFAEKIKISLGDLPSYSEEDFIYVDEFELRDKIDNLVKEMVGAESG